MAWIWSWATANNRERGEWVRVHSGVCKRAFGAGKELDGEMLCALFDLTQDELERVLAGSDYPERS